MSRSAIEAYVQALSRELSGLRPVRRAEWLNEVRAHLQDAAAALPGGDRAEREAEAVRRFGPASEVARTMLAESYLETSAEGFRPALTAKGLLYAMAGSTAWILASLLFSLCYVTLLLLAIASVSKWWLPDAGLWIHTDGSWSLSLHGFASSREILGPWLPLYGPIVCLLGWWGLNRALRAGLGWLSKTGPHPSSR